MRLSGGSSRRSRNPGYRFIWTHLYDPHDPYTPPEPYLSRHKSIPYDGEIEFTDANVATLFDWLRRDGLYDDTLIVVAGDHGESLGEHGESKHGFFIYNATLHVPLIVKFPRGQNAGKLVAESASLVDIFPTVLQILQVLIREQQRSRGRACFPSSSERERATGREIYAESYYPRLQFGWSELRALITETGKFVLAPKPELYDYRIDFPESHNLASEKSVQRFTVPSTRRSIGAKTAQIERIALEMINLRDKTDSAVFYPSPSRACSWCDYKAPCDIADESRDGSLALLANGGYVQGTRYDRYKDREAVPDA